MEDIKELEERFRGTKFKVVRKFTNIEAYDLLKDLIVKHKFHKDLYIMFGLWLSNLLNKRQFSYLKELCGGSINTTCFESNRIEYQELIQDIVLEFITFKKDPNGNIRGLVTKISWDKVPILDKKTKTISGYEPLEGNHGKIVAFIKGAFINCLYKCLSKSYRGDVNYSNLYTSKKLSKGKETELSRLKERMTDETDTSITTLELINKLKLEGFSDVVMFQYRYVYSLGNHKAFTELTDEIIIRASIIKEIKELASTDKYKLLVYEELFNILNSKLMPKINREFLKCYYGIPTVINFWEVKKFFNNDMAFFFEQYPEYKQVFKVKRVSYAGGRRVVTSYDKSEIIKESMLYKESHTMLKELLRERLLHLQDSYSNDLCDVNTLIKGLDVFSSSILDCEQGDNALDFISEDIEIDE
jgi:hypothetical protein